MKVFDHYARYYDLLYRDKDYRGESDFIISLLNKYAPQARSVLELGCGTGIHAQMIAESGYQVLGVDFSEAMLVAANERREGLSADMQTHLNFAQGDIRTYRTCARFDAVLSLFHVFSYQASNVDLDAAFRTASEHLKPEGVLIFDYWYGPAVLYDRPIVRKKILEDELTKVVREATPDLNTSDCTVTVNYKMKIIDKASKAESFVKEMHRMRYLFLPELELFSANVGLTPVFHGAWMGGGGPSEASWYGYSVFTKDGYENLRDHLS